MKIIKILTISFCIIIILSQNIFALGDILSTGEDWLTTGENKAGIGMNTATIQKGSNEIFNLLLGIATIVAIIVGAILGIKYMISGLDEKAQVKESLFPYLISCIVVFGSIGIWKIVVVIISEVQ